MDKERKEQGLKLYNAFMEYWGTTLDGLAEVALGFTKSGLTSDDVLAITGISLENFVKDYKEVRDASMGISQTIVKRRPLNHT